MDPLVIAVVAVSAGLHVAWNIRLKTAGDPLRAATVGMLAASVGIVPIGFVAWWVAGRAALPVEGVALGFVTSRLFEAGVITVGILSLLSIVTLKQEVGATAGARPAE